MKHFCCFTIGILWLFRLSSASFAAVPAEFIYETAPFKSCHASTIAETKSGLVAAWFGGTSEGNKDVGIWLSRKVDGKWTAPAEVANGVQSEKQRHPCWNPVLFQMPTGPLLLFFKVGPSPSKWWGEWMNSNDAGKTWSKPERLPDGGIGPVKNKPVLLADGTLLCGSSSEHSGWRVHFESSKDGGKSWAVSDAINDGKAIGAIQPSILVHGEKRLQALGRSRQGKIWESWSENNGRTWGPMKLIELPNSSTGTDAVTLKDGRHVLIYNHTPTGRSPLNVGVTTDGKIWKQVAVLEDKPGEYSYPAVIQSADGLIHVTYTWKRERIKHVTLDPAKF